MTEEVLGKIAVDRNGEKLGRIIRKEHLLGKTIKIEEAYAIIRVVQSFRVEVKIPVELSKVIKREGEKVWFNVIKKEFNEEVRKQRAVVKHTKATRETTRRLHFGYGGKNG
ncbi:MAG TPA: hypothetical protein VMZ29_06595 [Candidatus Bathyarchaeia archaeon]|nr:hypothetical protein [Candidatus Bathyarchaeia archaeon]